MLCYVICKMSILSGVIVAKEKIKIIYIYFMPQPAWNPKSLSYFFIYCFYEV